MASTDFITAYGQRLTAEASRMALSRRGFMAGAVAGGIAAGTVPGIAFAQDRNSGGIPVSDGKGFDSKGAGAVAIQGETAKGFENVREAFAASASEMGLGGAAFAAYLGGKPIINLWAGPARPGVPWARDTVSCYYSSTKAVAGMVAMRLVDQGKLQLDVPVAKYWPEFAANGKEKATVRQLLAMEAGFPYVPGYENFLVPQGGGWDQIEEIERRMASAAPITPIGTPAYAVLNYGYMVNAVVRRVSGGRQLKDIFNDEIARPIKADLWLDPPADVLRRAALIHADTGALRGDNPLRDKAFHLVNGHTIWRELHLWGMNPIHLRSGAASGDLMGTAEGMARLYAMMLGGGSLDGVKVLSPDVIKTFLVVQSTKDEAVLGRKSYWMLGGFESNDGRSYGPGARTFGKSGAGGQQGLGDPEKGLSIGFLRSHMGSSPLLNNLIKATYASL